MSRNLHRAISNEEFTLAVIETSSSGGRWGRPVLLSTVQVANKDIDQLQAAKIVNNPKITTLESWKADASSTGPRSNYSKTLSALLEELPNHVGGKIVRDTGRLTPTGDGTEIDATIKETKALNARLTARSVLGEVAQQSRPSDLASPEEAMARRNRGRAL